MVSIGKCLTKVNMFIQVNSARSSHLMASAAGPLTLRGTVSSVLKSSFSWCRNVVAKQHSHRLSSPAAYPTVTAVSACSVDSTVRFQSTDSKTKMVKSYEPPSPYKKPGPRRYGYETKIITGGTLPRVEHSRHNLPFPIYEPKDFWTRKKALFGQNDYIDILGDGDIHPADLIAGPAWLIGFRGNELQRLVRRMHFQGHKMKWMYPTKYHQMRKRIWFLYKKYNQKRPRGMGA
ncbi:39S ribosomal protein L51, mitochondrial-like [Gigantopelta aegis]|uniref:39S ribosomal protein L51, mitochondrial-like n=1 Tax=Gigantopelta aegis TaxID=1735272 RepID=UPI001B88D007|nr:39S ribosomal protein L51, mitochondrial-like [Gigantopelta aegis]